jgi:cell division protein FtsB
VFKKRKERRSQVDIDTINMYITWVEELSATETKLRADIQALEQGRDEQDTNYQQMILDFRDALEDMARKNLELQKELDYYKLMDALDDSQKNTS